jgi:hypothetical protein
MHDANSGATTIRHLRIVRKVQAQRNGEHPVHALEQKFVKVDWAEFLRGDGLKSFSNVHPSRQLFQH